MDRWNQAMMDTEVARDQLDANEMEDVGHDGRSQRELDEFEFLKTRLELALGEAKSWREYTERSLKSILPPSLPWIAIEEYAEARAREALALRKLQDLGFK